MAKVVRDDVVQRPLHPFQTAFRAILMAIALPAVIFMFGAIRSRQLKSTANPRWAKFAETSTSTESLSATSNGSRRVPVQTASIQNRDAESFQSQDARFGDELDQSRHPEVHYSGSITGRTSIEAPVRSRPLSTDESKRIAAESFPDEREGPPIIFRPVDDEPDDSQVSQMIVRFESQLSEVRQRLDRLSTRQYEEQSNETELESRLLDALTNLKEISSRSPAAPEVSHPTPVPVEVAAQPAMRNIPAIQKTPEVQHPQLIQTFPATQNIPAENPVPKEVAPEVIVSGKKPPETTHADTDASGLAVLSADVSKFAAKVPKSSVVPKPDAHPVPILLDTVTSPLANLLVDGNTDSDDGIHDQELKDRLLKPVDADSGSTNQGNHVSDSADWIRIRRTPDLNVPETYVMDVRDADIRHVFAELSKVARVNIISSPEVKGRVSLNLHGVRFDAAIKAILKSRDYVFDREDDIVVVRTADEMGRLKKQSRQTVLRIYRPDYITVAELNRLIQPILSSDGRQSVAPVAGPSGIDGSHRDDIDRGNTLVVQDLPEALERIDRILVDVDIPPLQVEIEAKILNVRLSSGIEHGIDFAQFPCYRDPEPSCSNVGLKHASLTCNVPTFIKSIERLAETRVVTSQRIQVLNNHRAEMLIGDRIGCQSRVGGEIRFMDAGTRLIVRPSISADGFVRMEIRPEQSSLNLARRTKQPQQTTAEMTTSVMIRDGATVAIGGLVLEPGAETPNRLNGMIAIPVLGIPFRNRRDRTLRTELIVLVTPHIICDSECLQGSPPQTTDGRFNSPPGQLQDERRHSLALAHFERASGFVRQGNYVKARQQIEASLRQNNADQEAIRLRNEISQSLPHDVQ